ncbi:methyl-accepting chemotaxis protein [Virgibacillus litoralis]|uniref:Methyl-accepting chemotaxis protein n=1 Tax=Virgibacillus litoralis TaxID=578221 RepID=A0ABS4HAT6_9BACI|nr:methyl-accepting chemotaxis protein [Virgibacillus litoralis]MBP1948024.1 methyl-accepting chemotaxis protein [Virgibacillus litoralis]
MGENKKKKQEIKKKGSFLSKSLQRQILIPFLSLIIIAGAVIAFTNYTLSKNMIIDQKAQSVETQMTNLNDTFNVFFDNTTSILNRLTQNELFIDYDENNRQAIVNYLGETVEANTNIANIYTGVELSSETTIYPETDLPDDFDPRERDWYKAALEADGEVIWTQPYVDAASGKTIVTAAQSYSKYGQVVGVIGADVLVDTLISMTNNIQTGESGYAMIIDQQGTFIAHPNDELVGKSAEKAAFYSKLSSNGENGVIEYTENDEGKILGFTTNNTTGWVLGETVFKSDFSDQASSILIPIIATLLIILLLAIVISFFTTRRITKPIKNLQGTMKEVENGNLLAKTTIQTHNEIGQLSESFDNMLQQMRMMMIKIKDVSFNVSEASQTLVASAEENTASSNEVATTMEQIATGAGEQSEIMEQNAAATEKLSTLIKQIEEYNKKVYDEARVMDEVSEKGAETVSGLRKQSEETGQITSEVVRAIQSLDDKSTNINEIVTKIADIASQTNLLALNAAIEAARAGENGRGFAVVADEVRKLAEQSESALGDISTLIGEMQAETKHSVTLIGKTNKVIQTQSQSVGETEQAFTSIQQTIHTNNQLINKVMDIMETIISQEQIISGNTQSIASISEETAAGTEETSASIEEQTASMEQLNHLAEELETYAIEMQQQVNKFKIDENN